MMDLEHEWLENSLYRNGRKVGGRGIRDSKSVGTRRGTSNLHDYSRSLQQAGVAASEAVPARRVHASLKGRIINPTQAAALAHFQPSKPAAAAAAAAGISWCQDAKGL